MSHHAENQISDWLKKLERESWQLELLVSAFTIFLLIGASEAFSAFLTELSYTYSFEDSLLAFFVLFLSLVLTSIKVLTAFLIIHLLLRGFWIGAIGLRSVQPEIDYEKLRYSEFFLDKLKRKVIGLDRLIVVLDEICSVLFSLSFLIIFMILSFGLYCLFLGGVVGVLSTVTSVFNVSISGVFFLLVIVLVILLILTGLIYLIDYFTLGFFKKLKWFGRIYYPIYRFYSLITLSFLSRSIYYHLISKYSKRKIRLLYGIIAVVLFSRWFVNFDQYQYFPEGETNLVLSNNYYDESRTEDDYVEKVSVESKYVTGEFLSLFLRYNPNDNPLIRSNCPDFEPLKNDGINPNLRMVAGDGSFFIRSQNFEDEDKEMLLSCLTAFYEISVNDSIYADLPFYFHEHPHKEQKGLLTIISTEGFEPGENVVSIRQRYISPSDSTLVVDDFATVPIWFSK